MENDVQLRIVERVLLHGQRIVLKAHGLDGVGCDGIVDELGVRMLRIRHDDGEARQVFLCGFDVAEVGKVVALAAANDRNALCHTVFRGIRPVMLGRQQQRIDLALVQKLLILFNVFHAVSSMFQLQ